MDGVKVLRIGVAPAGYVKQRMIEIAGGSKPLPREPKVWVSSLDSVAKALTESNLRLLQLIRDGRPQSLSALARLSGRSLPNLSRTLHTLERLGIVAFEEKADGRKVPVVLYTKVQLVLDFAAVRSKAA
jgi:predicted transcriptional regulator